ncbi:hypothetical protein B0T18DRAFT_384927 [Schizothecium vesticola]|uniref:Uncharacterized protein n=1 Tax=Schizothecium vesticola TaxID=314040 RepID=A0AA40F7N6_9PEZI|nr:hypothetical protein B0T18DRAFT_384927 [Schizothecium vesticola]
MGHRPSPAVAVILWVVGGLIVFYIALSWLELGLAISLHYVRPARAYFWAPRSGGDKNYLEYIYKRARLLANCVFGISFILFGNLAGNTIQFGVYIQSVISPQCTENDACFGKAGVILWALGIICFCSFLNVTTRQLFIKLNNIIGVLKFLFVLATALLSIIYGASHGDGCRTSLAWPNRGAGEPFYVLADVKRPRDTFAKYVMLAMASVLVVFPLANVGYHCVVAYNGPQSVPGSIALEFFAIIARYGDRGADTTATSRGVSMMLVLGAPGGAYFATILYTISAALFIIVVGASTKASTAFRILTYLRVFSMVVILGLFTVAGLAYLKIDS